MNTHSIWLQIQYQEWKFHLDSIKDTKSSSYLYARNTLNYISKQFK